jgi:hypothetical protein
MRERRHKEREKGGREGGRERGNLLSPAFFVCIDIINRFSK